MRMREHCYRVSPDTVMLYVQHADFSKCRSPSVRKGWGHLFVCTITSLFLPNTVLSKNQKCPIVLTFQMSVWRRPRDGWQIGSLSHLLGLVIRRERDSSCQCESKPSLVSRLIYSLRLPLLMEKDQCLQTMNHPSSPKHGPRGCFSLGDVSPLSVKDVSGKVTQLLAVASWGGSHQAEMCYCSFFCSL